MVRPFIVYKLDRDRKLRLGISAMCLVEELTGKTINELFPVIRDEEGRPVVDAKGQVQIRVPMRHVRALLYACMTDDDPDLTEEGVGELIDEYSDVETAIRKVTETFNASFGKKKAGEVKADANPST